MRLLWLVVTMGIIAPLHTQAQTPFPNRAMRIIIPTGARRR
ncbi:MAG TPA: hypothetical protein VFI62_13260 [Burkholderiales bacterium]|nr:hypothetical protein [Burkholderiales bacterium]